MNEHVCKIKQTLRQLGFSLSIVESLTDSHFHYSTENEHFKHSKYIISDSSNIKIFELELYEYNDYNTISLKFEQQQEILKRINLTTYDKKIFIVTALFISIKSMTFYTSASVMAWTLLLIN